MCSLDAAALNEPVYQRDYSALSVCALKYLKSEGKLKENFPLRDKPLTCSRTLPDICRLLRAKLKKFTEKMLPNEANCITMEFSKRDETMDRFLIIYGIQMSGLFSESEKKTLLIPYRNEANEDLEDIATKCHVAKDNFTQLFDESFEHNDTVAGIESDYCLAKYVTDRNILALPNVNLNPNNVATEKLDCNVVMEEEMNKAKENFRSNITLSDETMIECIMNWYEENKIFDLDIASIVLSKLEMSTETKCSELNKVNKNRAIFAETFNHCFTIDIKDDRANVDKY